jgi:hypothetical protein
MNNKVIYQEDNLYLTQYLKEVPLEKAFIMVKNQKKIEDLLDLDQIISYLFYLK